MALSGGSVPDHVRRDVERALEAVTGRAARITETAPVGGGCISPVARAETADGDVFFLKWSSPDHPRGLLGAEARGLEMLSAAGTVRVPTVVASSDHGTWPEWLLLEWLPSGRATGEGWEALGAGVAGLHRSQAAEFGAAPDNFIGTLPQSNESSGDWPEFWATRRLEPQLRMAVDAGYFSGGDRRRFSTLVEHLGEILQPGQAEGASLLHGDLWGGNVHFTDSQAALVDPSVYHGHREVDLAMSELFGGFGPGFHQAYREVWPLADGYDPDRRAVYELYYLLVHVNLFGAGYVSGCRTALSRAGF